MTKDEVIGIALGIPAVECEKDDDGAILVQTLAGSNIYAKYPAYSTNDAAALEGIKRAEEINGKIEFRFDIFRTDKRWSCALSLLINNCCVNIVDKSGVNLDGLVAAAFADAMVEEYQKEEIIGNHKYKTIKQSHLRPAVEKALKGVSE